MTKERSLAVAQLPCFFFVSLLKALRMIDGDSKYLDDEVMDFVFRQQRLAVLQSSSIVLNQGVPEIPRVKVLFT